MHDTRTKHRRRRDFTFKKKLFFYFLLTLCNTHQNHSTQQYLLCLTLTWKYRHTHTIHKTREKGGLGKKKNTVNRVYWSRDAYKTYVVLFQNAVWKEFPINFSKEFKLTIFGLCLHFYTGISNEIRHCGDWKEEAKTWMKTRPRVCVSSFFVLFLRGVFSIVIKMKIVRNWLKQIYFNSNFYRGIIGGGGKLNISKVNVGGDVDRWMRFVCG